MPDSMQFHFEGRNGSTERSKAHPLPRYIMPAAEIETDAMRSQSLADPRPASWLSLSGVGCAVVEKDRRAVGTPSRHPRLSIRPALGLLRDGARIPASGSTQERGAPGALRGAARHRLRRDPAAGRPSRRQRHSGGRHRLPVRRRAGRQAIDRPTGLALGRGDQHLVAGFGPTPSSPRSAKVEPPASATHGPHPGLGPATRFLVALSGLHRRRRGDAGGVVL